MNLLRTRVRRLPGGTGCTAAPPGLLALLLALSIAGAPACARGASPAPEATSLAPVPDYHGYVNDVAGVIGEPRVAQLESFLDQLHEKTGAQFAVLTVQTCEPEDPTQYKTRVFNTWGIGDKERDDGVLLLVAMKERAVYFETGYGLEGTLPDGWQARMLRDLAFPEFRAGRPADGITAAVLAASKRIAKEKDVKLEWDGKELRYEDSDGVPNWVIMLILFVLFFIILPAVASQSRYRRRRGWYSSGGWGGGFGGFGGGFGGGSFSSGGGGGGGGSFGGFGGGSSGGGGGGGRW